MLPVEGACQIFQPYVEGSSQPSKQDEALEFVLHGLVFIEAAGKLLGVGEEIHCDAGFMMTSQFGNSKPI